MTDGNFTIRASSVPSSFRLCGASEGFELLAAADTGDAAAPDGKPKLRRFNMVAYTGVQMRLFPFPYPVVVDLQGVKLPSQSRPVLRDHAADRIVGHTDTIEVTAQRIKAAGIISGVGQDAAEVLQLASNGFPWQASIGASAERMEFVDRGEKVNVNGRSFTGPLYVARATTLGEISFVAMGADTASSANVAAQHFGGNAVNFEQWLQAKGFDAATLSEAQKATLQAAFTAEQQTANPPAPAPDFTERRRLEAAEANRVAGIRRICASAKNPDMEITDAGGKRTVSIEAHAIEQGWNQERVELEVLRASRPQAPNVIVARGPDTAPIVLEAALCLNLNIPGTEKAYKPEVLEAADKHFRRLGLQQVFLIAAAQNGYHAGPGQRIHAGNLREVLEYALPPLRAGMQSVSLPGILGNIANKELLTGYMEEDQSWREVAAIKSVSDFKSVTSYRMLDSMEYEEVGPGGEIKHGTVDQESYSRQAKTFAKMFALTRTDMINDDLGAFEDLRNRLGRGGAQKFNNVFWNKFLSDHATFFTAARGNYITGATTNLGADGVGLGLGIKAFRQMKSGTADGGKRIGGQPDRLIVPPELEGVAEVLYRNQNLDTVKASDANIYANKYKPVVVPWLSDSNFTGYSTTAWYLFRNPATMPMMVASFLNGNQTPTVESADADFDVLGVQFRGYHDFGCDQAEYLCGVKSKGAA